MAKYFFREPPTPLCPNVKAGTARFDTATDTAATTVTLKIPKFQEVVDQTQQCLKAQYPATSHSC